MIWKALLVWLGLVVLAMVNGAVRELWISPKVGVRTGRILSSVLLAALIVLVAFLTIGWIGPRTPQEAFLIGGSWMVLTIGFEFLAGRYLFGTSWEDLAANYAFWRGRTWILVLLATLFAPWIAGRTRDMLGG